MEPYMVFYRTYMYCLFQRRSVCAALRMTVTRHSAGRVTAVPSASVRRSCATAKWRSHNRRQSNATSVNTALIQLALAAPVLEKFASLQDTVRLRSVVLQNAGGGVLRWGRGSAPPRFICCPSPQIQKLADRSDVISEVPKCSKIQNPDPAGKLIALARPSNSGRGLAARCPFNSPNFNSPNSNYRVRVRDRDRVGDRVRLGLGLGIGFGELKFGELKRNPLSLAKNPMHYISLHLTSTLTLTLSFLALSALAMLTVSRIVISRVFSRPVLIP